MSGPARSSRGPRSGPPIVRLRPTHEPRFDIGSDGALRMLVHGRVLAPAQDLAQRARRACSRGEDIEACGIDPQLRPETL